MGKLITGEGSKRPVRLLYNDWLVVEGINACRSSDTVVELSHSNNNVIRRVTAWDAADNNSTIFTVHNGLYNRLEDVAGRGTARQNLLLLDQTLHKPIELVARKKLVQISADEIEGRRVSGKPGR
jgi:hypothetical protein